MLKLDWIEALGDRNPQLLRELKGRLKPRNLVLVVAISLLGQFLLLMAFLVRLPQGTLNDIAESSRREPYCTGSIDYGRDRTCLVDGLGNLLVDWQKWSLDLFLALSVIGIFSLLVAGTYLLIDNLAYEERRGTLNFIRLSPRSPQSILWGKIFGVPILIYLVALSAVPLHLWVGVAAHIPLIRILGFYGVLGTSCIFFYSLSLLFGLVSAGVNGFQAWLGSGTVFLFILVGISKPVEGDPTDWINIFSPGIIVHSLIVANGIKPTILFSDLGIQKLQWFNLPIGMGIVGISSILILNYCLWTYWTWQALQRRFASPTKTIFNKRQSYLLVAGFEIVALGFAGSGGRYHQTQNFAFLLTYNFVLFLGLIITLTPQRQTLVDWARYRQRKPSHRKGLLNLSLLRDLVWGEKSSAIVAIALNAAITFTILIPWIVLSSYNDNNLSVLMALVLSLSLIVIGATIAQLVVFMQTRQQGLWIIGVLSAVTILPPLTLGLLSVDIVSEPTLWLFTVFAFTAIENAGVLNIFLALVGQLSVLTLCSLQISRQLKKSAESNSIGLFAPPKASLP